MKLRNKKTGEIIELLAKPSFVKRNDNYLQSEVNTFNSLAELNANWEDVPEEPKEYFYIISSGEFNSIFEDEEDEEDTKVCKEIGNYFETKEEAEKAVEKLKAVKRLKDKGFKLKGWYMPKSTLKIEIDGGFPEGVSLCDVMDDLDIIFGGEK